MIDFEELEKSKAKAFSEANGKANLAIIAPTILKFVSRYSIENPISYSSENPPKCVVFWHEYDENGIFSQWHKTLFKFNGREYSTCEQFMMSEKALLFEDFVSYKKIMEEQDPQKCKVFGKGVKNFDQDKWNANFREIIFMGNLFRAQYDIDFLYALLNTEYSLLIETSPYDDIYGAGMEKKDLLDSSGFLKIPPEKWHKKGSQNQAQNNLGFVLMGLRDFYNDFLKVGGR